MKSHRQVCDIGRKRLVYCAYICKRFLLWRCQFRDTVQEEVITISSGNLMPLIFLLKTQKMNVSLKTLYLKPRCWKQGEGGRPDGRPCHSVYIWGWWGRLGPGMPGEQWLQHGREKMGKSRLVRHLSKQMCFWNLPWRKRPPFNRLIYFRIQQPKQKRSIYFLWAAKHKSL